MDAMSDPVEPAARELVLTRVFDAPRRLVFKAWTDAPRVARWWGPRGFTNPVCEVDARPAGAIRIDMRGPDGTVYPMTGVIKEIVEPERLVFTSAALDAEGHPMFEVLTTVTLAERGGETTLTLHARVIRETAGADRYLDGMEAGWTQSLDRLGEYVQSTRDNGGSSARDGGAASAADREIVISREFDAPRELVWKAWTDPEHVVRWWGPKGFTTTIETMDVRPGGVWKHVMHGPDGADYPNKSVFTEVVKPERIAYSHGGGRKGGPGVRFEATWTFEAVDDGRTRLTIRQVFASAADRDRIIKEFNAVEGGQQTLARLAQELARVPVVVARTFDAPINVVWRAITDTDRLRAWSFADLESFRPEVGFQTQFTVRKNGKDYLHIWEVTEVVPGRKIAYRWKFGGLPGESLVTFELAAVGDTTRLTLTHEGLETFQPESHPELARGNFLKGWTQLIGSSLADFLEGSAPQSKPSFVFTRVFDASRELVFKAWTELERLREWWGPKGFAVVPRKLDLRPGGVFHYCMRTPAGRDIWGQFFYREIVAPERIVFVNSFSDEDGGLTRNPWMENWPLEVLKVLTLTEREGRTTLTLKGYPINATDEERVTFQAGIESMQKGFEGTFDQLAAYLARA
jgi:uncharacterized protein YndB with AHSA1/START domain